MAEGERAPVDATGTRGGALAVKAERTDRALPEQPGSDLPGTGELRDPAWAAPHGRDLADEVGLPEPEPELVGLAAMPGRREQVSGVPLAAERVISARRSHRAVARLGRVAAAVAVAQVSGAIRAERRPVADADRTMRARATTLAMRLRPTRSIHAA